MREITMIEVDRQPLSPWPMPAEDRLSLPFRQQRRGANLDAMTTIRSLASPSQPWLLIDAAHRCGDQRASHAASPQFSPAGWLPATVPGVCAQDLLAAGRIADPYYGEQVMACRWIEERDWIYRTALEISATDALRPARLCFDSLDVFADIYLNGVKVASHSNQFRRLVIDLSGKLVVGTNLLVVVFEASWPGTVRRAGERKPHWNDPWERMWIRRSQMAYGWDWAARTPLAGILDEVRLEFAEGLWAGDLQVRATPLATGSAGSAGPGRLQLDLPVEGLTSGDISVEALCNGVVIATQRLEVHPGTMHQVHLEATIPEVAYWFPFELGTPHLHQVTLRLHRAGMLIHEVGMRVGFRHIELQTRDAASPNGKVFRYAINGEKFWAKGDNWLPIDFMHTRVTRAQYRDYLLLLRAGGVNCIRVWGGGIVEHAAFYDLCDELGLIVWHDFFFACGIYPDTPEFLAEVARETADIVTRLRSRTCIAMWCGNNENELLAQPFVDGGAPLAYRQHPLYYEVIPSVLRELDPERAWWPGSPASESMAENANSDQEGDRHNWDVWFGWRTTEFIGDVARFNSEFGAQAFPQLESLESFMHPDDIFCPGAVASLQGASPGRVLARHGAQFEKLFARAGAFGPLTGTNAIIATTQAFQADTIGRYIRHYRRNIAFTGGVVVWNYTATWPSVCWALIDWYRRPKQAFYECRRAFRALTVGIEPLDAQQAVFIAHVAQDRPGQAAGEVVLQLRRIADGGVVAESRGNFALAGAAAASPARLTLPTGLSRLSHALVATATHAGGCERDVRYLVPINDVAEVPDGHRLVHAKTGTLTVVRHADRIELSSTAWRLRVGIESLEHPAIWDDNYFDLLPGESATLRIVHGAMPQHLWVVADMGTRVVLPPGATVHL